MFVDARAIISMIAHEQTSAVYAAALSGSRAPWTSALAAWEAILVLSRPDQLNRGFLDSETLVVEWLGERKIELRESPAPRQVLAEAVAVAQAHGVGKRALSSLDFFHYAYAKVAKEPMLTLDARLRGTDLATLP